MTLPILLLLFLCSLASCQTYNYNGVSGTFYSPNYPKNYDNSANAEYVITVPDGYFIHLTFLDFLTEDPYDFVAIQEGTGDEAVALQNYSKVSGDKTGLSVVVNSTEATILFTSDLTTTFRGFAIKYDAVPTGNQFTPVNTCSSLFHVSSFGIITSPNFPENYPDSASCSSLLMVAEGYKITLQFVAFNTEAGYDIVYVYDGSNNSYPLLGQFSGKKLPAAITSSSNSLYIFFQSDLVNNFSGFSALVLAENENNEYRRGVLPQAIETSTDATARRDVNILKWLKEKKSGKETAKIAKSPQLSSSQ